MGKTNVYTTAKVRRNGNKLSDIGIRPDVLLGCSLRNRDCQLLCKIVKPAAYLVCPFIEFTDRIRSISRLTSFAVTKGRSFPVRFTLYIFGMVI